MIRLENVALRYGEGPEVLRNLNLTLQRGEFLFVTGPSGAGKTSLLRMLALLHMPAAGRLIVFNEDVAQLSRDRLAAVRRRIGVVFQDVRLLDHLSTFDNVALPLRISDRTFGHLSTAVGRKTDLPWGGTDRLVVDPERPFILDDASAERCYDMRGVGR
jgi:ABC-type ATPase involved in cell division